MMRQEREGYATWHTASNGVDITYYGRDLVRKVVSALKGGSAQRIADSLGRDVGEVAALKKKIAEIYAKPRLVEELNSVESQISRLENERAKKKVAEPRDAEKKFRSQMNEIKSKQADLLLCDLAGLLFSFKDALPRKPLGPGTTQANVMEISLTPSNLSLVEKTSKMWPSEVDHYRQAAKMLDGLAEGKMSVEVASPLHLIKLVQVEKLPQAKTPIGPLYRLSLNLPPTRGDALAGVFSKPEEAPVEAFLPQSLASGLPPISLRASNDVLLALPRVYAEWKGGILLGKVQGGRGYFHLRNVTDVLTCAFHGVPLDLPHNDNVIHFMKGGKLFVVLHSPHHLTRGTTLGAVRESEVREKYSPPRVARGLEKQRGRA